MFDTPNNTRRWKMPRPSISQLLIMALVLNLIFSGYLLSRLNGRTRVSGQTTPLSPAASSTPDQPGPASTSLASPDINSLIAQMQVMQNNLQVTSIQLAQKGQSAGLAPAPTALVDKDLPALLAEVEQLYQVMQPLMAQIETANASRSSRSNSELIALRTQVNTIHQRLTYLLARVEAVKTRSNVGSGTGMTQAAAPAGALANPTIPDPAMFGQLYQNMAELQSLLQQMQDQGTNP